MTRFLCSLLHLLPFLLARTAANNQTEPESLPSPEPWSDQPLCPLWGPMEGFYSEGISAGRYLGRWWLQDKFAQLSDLRGKCRSQVYSVNLVNKTIHRHTDYLTAIGNQPSSESGLISFEDIKDSNLLKYTEGKADQSSLVYRVLATDYDTFTIEYNCEDSNIIKRKEQIWIYTRAKIPTRNVLKRAYKSLKILGLNGWKLKKADQSCAESDAVSASRRNSEVASRTRARARPDLSPLRLQRRTSSLQRERPTPAPAPMTTGELTSRMLGSGLKLAQSVLAPWTLHPVMGFERNQGALRKSLKRRLGKKTSKLRRFRI